MAGNAIRRFFGGSPAWVIVRLILLSLIVGVILAALNLDVFKIVEGVQDLIRGIIELGFDAFGSIFRYLLLGAAIVVPIWLVMRVLALMNRDRIQ
ncbi:MAG: DUF6460 domain-containing protein [Pseudomonadota bacterium]